MCYSGKCGYESYSGECEIHPKNIPNDALCVSMEIEQYNFQKDEFEKDLKFLMIKTEYEDKVAKNIKNKHNGKNLNDLEVEINIFYELLSIYRNDNKLEKISF